RSCARSLMILFSLCSKTEVARESIMGNHNATWSAKRGIRLSRHIIVYAGVGPSPGCSRVPREPAVATAAAHPRNIGSFRAHRYAVARLITKLAREKPMLAKLPTREVTTAASGVYPLTTAAASSKKIRAPRRLLSLCQRGRRWRRKGGDHEPQG